MKTDIGDVLFTLEQKGMTGHLKAVRDLLDACQDITAVYDRVASGQTRGAGGTHAADGKSTLCAVHIPVESIEKLASLTGCRVHPRS